MEGLKQRVKVYRLNEDGHWDDCGTGFAQVKLVDKNTSPGIVVVDEDDDNTLLVHRIDPEVDYIIQEDNAIITWSDPCLKTDIALSFQEVNDCRTVYSQVDRLRNSTEEDIIKFLGVNQDMMDDSQIQFTDESQSSKPFPLLPLEIGRLDVIAQAIAEISPLQRDCFISQINPNTFVPRLVDIFQQCEDLEDDTALESLCRIVKGCLCLMDGALAEEMFKKENLLQVIGMLERDPDIKLRVRHREFLNKCVCFKQVVEIEDKRILENVHHSYQLQYAKDTVVARLMDDNVILLLSQIIALCNANLVVDLSNDRCFFLSFFDKLHKTEPNSQDWRDLVKFLHEYCVLAKNLEAKSRQVLFEKLNGIGLYNSLKDFLKFGDSSVKCYTIEIMMQALYNDPNGFRSFLFEEDNEELLDRTVEILITGGSDGSCYQSLEILQVLLDPESLSTKSFLDFFYQRSINRILDALTSGLHCNSKSDGSPSEEFEYVHPSCKAAILDFLCFCVQHHAYNIKYMIVKNLLFEKVVHLLQENQKWLVISALRFLRCCVGMKDDFFIRAFIRNKIFDLIIAVYQKNRDRNNMLNSVILEMIEFIISEKIKEFIEHLYKEHYENLKAVSNIATFEKLKNEYEKINEGGVSLRQGKEDDANGDKTKRKFRRDERDLDREEEEYFAESSGEASPSPEEEDKIELNTTKAECLQRKGEYNDIIKIGCEENVDEEEVIPEGYRKNDETSLSETNGSPKVDSKNGKVEEVDVSDTEFSSEKSCHKRIYPENLTKSNVKKVKRDLSP